MVAILEMNYIMKRPLFNEITRQVMIENKSFYAERLHAGIAVYRLRREMDRMFFIESIIKLLRKLT